MYNKTFGGIAMEQAIKMNIGGLKCDTKDCVYRDDSIKVEDYVDWIDKPCPKCGGNLLTKADYNNVQMMINLVNLTNGMFPAPKEDEQLFKISVDMDGTGKMDTKVEKHYKS